MTPLVVLFSFMIAAGAVLIVCGMRQCAGGDAESQRPEDLFLGFTESPLREEASPDPEEGGAMPPHRDKTPFRSGIHEPEALDVSGRAGAVSDRDPV